MFALVCSIATGMTEAENMINRVLAMEPESAQPTGVYLCFFIWPYGLCCTSAVVQQCRLLNVSLCPITATNNFRVNIWNPNPQDVKSIVRYASRFCARVSYCSFVCSLPVTNQNVIVFEADQTTRRPSQVVPAPLSAAAGAPGFTLVFTAALPSLGGSVYYVKPGPAEQHTTVSPMPQAAVIENEMLRVTFADSGLVSVSVFACC